mmetsp:Transcript_23487/g.58013  ORF Transcript_23487/g.58013 Transcript_23487/m.58013 type:complete len:215 (+) Transcript_23487:1666-2310(+)
MLEALPLSRPGPTGGELVKSPGDDFPSAMGSSPMDGGRMALGRLGSGRDISFTPPSLGGAWLIRFSPPLPRALAVMSVWMAGGRGVMGPMPRCPCPCSKRSEVPAADSAVDGVGSVSSVEEREDPATGRLTTPTPRPFREMLLVLGMPKGEGGAEADEFDMVRVPLLVAARGSSLLKRAFFDDSLRMYVSTTVSRRSMTRRAAAVSSACLHASC